MLGKKLGIDLGSATLRVFVKGEGVVLTEPSVVAMAGDGEGMAFGRAAAEMAGSPGVELVHPVREGRLADQAAADELLRLAVTRVVGRQRIFKPDMVIAVTSTLPGPQRRHLLDAATRFGARTVYLLDAPMAAAMGSEVPLVGPRARLIIDCGAGKTEVCALAEEGTISGRCLTGGIGELEPYVARLSSALRDVLADVPSELEPGLRSDGALLHGGGAHLDGLAGGLHMATGLPVTVADEPHLAAVRGAGMAVDNLDMLKRNLMYIR